jgi:hypothetical protein
MEKVTENSIDEFIRCSDDSWVSSLNPDPETQKFEPNKKSREVKSGHYVLVKYAHLALNEMDSTLGQHRFLRRDWWQ